MSDFWERRRRAVEAEARAEAEAEATRTAEAERRALDDMDDAALCEHLGLPDPDAIGPGDDVAAFMRAVVPARLRNRALRRLWASNPVLANLDGLNDYDGDFTGNGLSGGALRTSYEVGKGLAAHVRRMAEPDGPAVDAAAAKDQLKESEKSVGFEGDEVNYPLADGRADVTSYDGTPPASDTGGQEDGARPRMRFSFGEDDQDERPDAADTGRPVRGGPPPR
jgi:hypothetical protein